MVPYPKDEARRGGVSDGRAHGLADAPEVGDIRVWPHRTAACTAKKTAQKKRDKNKGGTPVVHYAAAVAAAVATARTARPRTGAIN